MTQITDVLARVARQCSVKAPTSWLTTTSGSAVELRDDFLLETVADVQKRLDLPSPIGKQYVLTGDGSETYDLPSDFFRLQRDLMAVYETTTVRRRMYPVTDDGTWTHLKQIGSTGGDRYYRIQGYPGAYTISIYREPASPISVTISYVSDLWAHNGGTAKSTFNLDTDELLMPRELVEAGMVYRFRERRGLDYTTKKREYETEMARFSNDSRGRYIVTFGRQEKLAPWDIPVPDYIPSGS